MLPGGCYFFRVILVSGEESRMESGGGFRRANVDMTIRARAHRIFAGKLDKSQLGFADKLIVKVLRAPEGDFRDSEAIPAWADDIA